MKADRPEASPDGAGDTEALRARVHAELVFFEGAVDRARLWQRVWDQSPPEAREGLLTEQSRLLGEVLERDRTLQDIYRTWQGWRVSMGPEDQARVEAEVRRLDRAMRSLLEIQKAGLEATQAIRRELLREIGDVRTAQELLSNLGDSDRSEPRCIDRKL